MPTFAVAGKFVALPASLLLATIPFAAQPSHAVNRNYKFDVTIDFGPLSGNSYSGSFSFNDAADPAFLTDFDFNFEGQSYDELDDPFGEASLNGSEFVGIIYNITGPPAFSFVPGFTDPDESLFTYDLQQSTPGQAGFGSIAYTRLVAETTDVPGPLPLMGAAAFFGYTRKLRKRLSSF